MMKDFTKILWQKFHNKRDKNFTKFLKCVYKIYTRYFENKKTQKSFWGNYYNTKLENVRNGTNRNETHNYSTNKLIKKSCRISHNKWWGLIID